jgi:hypothetical protein
VPVVVLFIKLAEMRSTSFVPVMVLEIVRFSVSVKVRSTSALKVASPVTLRMESSAVPPVTVRSPEMSTLSFRVRLPVVSRTSPWRSVWPVTTREERVVAPP